MNGGHKRTNVAVMSLSPLPAGIMQRPMPPQALPHPENVISLAATASSETATSVENDPEHVPGQEIPVGVDVTVPDPETVTTTVREEGGDGFEARTNLASIVVSVTGESVHSVVPAQLPVNPSNRDSGSAMGVSTSAVPKSTAVTHVVRQSNRPAEYTCPVPSPAIVTVTRICLAGDGAAVDPLGSDSMPPLHAMQSSATAVAVGRIFPPAEPPQS